MDILKGEIAARERCEFMKHSDNEIKRNQDKEIKDKRHSTELFLKNVHFVGSSIITISVTLSLI